MKRQSFLLLMAVVACDSSPVAPGPPSDSAAQSAALVASSHATTVMIRIPLQLVTAYEGGTAAREVRISGGLMVSDGPERRSVAGRIVMVPAAGQTAQHKSSGTVVFTWDIAENVDAVIRLEGTATLAGEDGTGESFPITGTVRPMPGNSDCLIFDILGSDVYDDGLSFEVFVSYDHKVEAPRDAR